MGISKLYSDFQSITTKALTSSDETGASKNISYPSFTAIASLAFYNIFFAYPFLTILE